MVTLTYAPLPNWKNLASSLLRYPTDDQIVEPWLQSDEAYFWFSRSAWSLCAVALFRTKVFHKEKIRVWLPGFFCNASLAPLRDIGVALQFYPLLSDGKPDMDTCEQMLKDGSPDLIVFAHYFGQPFYSKDLSCFAKINNAWLVEDCAHCLKPERGVGKTGDFVMYSPHKFLTLPDGALLLIRNDGPSKLINADFDALYHSLPFKKIVSYSASVKWLAKRILQKIGVRSSSPNVEFHDDNVVMDSESLPHPKMSFLAKSLLITMVSGFEMEAENRKRNALQWNSSLTNHLCVNQEVIPLFNGSTPYLVGFEAKSKSQAEKIFYCFQNANVPVTTWPDLPPEVLNDVDIQKVSIEMRTTRFYFPVHSSIKPEIIMETLRCIK